MGGVAGAAMGESWPALVADELGVNWNSGTADAAETIESHESRCAYRPHSCTNVSFIFFKSMGKSRMVCAKQVVWGEKKGECVSTTLTAGPAGK